MLLPLATLFADCSHGFALSFLVSLSLQSLRDTAQPPTKLVGCALSGLHDHAGTLIAPDDPVQGMKLY
jgi:hypothetical protein